MKVIPIENVHDSSNENNVRKNSFHCLLIIFFENLFVASWAFHKSNMHMHGWRNESCTYICVAAQNTTYVSYCTRSASTQPNGKKDLLLNVMVPAKNAVCGCLNTESLMESRKSHLKYASPVFYIKRTGTCCKINQTNKRVPDICDGDVIEYRELESVVCVHSQVGLGNLHERASMIDRYNGFLWGKGVRRAKEGIQKELKIQNCMFEI